MNYKQALQLKEAGYPFKKNIACSRFVNENNETRISGSIPSANFTYWLGSGSVRHSEIYSNSTEASEYLFCSDAGSRTLNLDYRIQYESTGAPQRVADPGTITLTNSSLTNKSLYILPSADGIYVTFQVINIADQLVTDVIMNATRLVGSSQEVVGAGTTDSSGAVTLWLNPDFIHTFNFVKTGQTSVTTSFAPTQTGYTITMGTTSSINNTDFTKGVTSITLPGITLKSLYNGTDVPFNWTLASSIFTITSWGFNLTGDNDILIESVTSTDNGGFLGTTINTKDNSSIIMYQWYVSGGDVHEFTRYWKVISSEGSENSLVNFFSHLTTYMDTGIFGLQSFGFKLIVFVSMFVFIGVMSYMYGLQNEGILSVLVFGVVFWVDYGLDLIPPVVGMPYFPTFIVGLITLGILSRGWRV